MNAPLLLLAAGLTVIAASLASLAYLRLLRPWQLTWGATPDEVSRPLPGDAIVSDPTFDATRAITIAAPPEQIWPWLLQVGSSGAAGIPTTCSTTWVAPVRARSSRSCSRRPSATWCR